MLAKTRKPRIMPRMSPAPLTIIALTARDSPFDFPIPPRMSPAGPKIIGRKRNATAPQINPMIEKVLPGEVGLGGAKVFVMGGCCDP